MFLLPVLTLAASCSSAEDEVKDPAETPDAFASKYAELREQGKSHKAATELATLYVGGSVDTGGSTGGDRVNYTEGQYAMDTVILLATYSSEDSYESVQRKQAAEELKIRFQSRDVDSRDAMNLLDTIAPEASINKRREAAKELARLSEIEDWNDRNTLDAAEELTRLITGDRINAEKRVRAANELTRRSKAGNLDADGAFNLMNDIAPELSINKRREAASNLARISKTENWNAETTEQAMEESFKVITGGDLDHEKRRDAAVDLTGEGLKRFGGDSFEDRDIDVAGEMIKSSFRGDLTTDKVSDLLGLDD